MVVKTNICSFSEFRIYPGKGRRFVSKDGRVHIFLNHKIESLFHQRKKAVRLRWSPAWRRFNKKGKVEETRKKRTKRVTKAQKSIIGMSLDEIKRKRNEKPEERKAAYDQALREVKERKRKQIEGRKADKAKVASKAKPAAAGAAQKGKKPADAQKAPAGKGTTGGKGR